MIRIRRKSKNPLPLGWQRLPITPWEPSAEDREELRRWRERRDAVLQQRLRDLYGS